jgi:hypothetical protein
VTDLTISPMSAVSRRRGLVEWAMTSSTHSIDLAPNRHDTITPLILERMLSRFCLGIDHYVLQCKHVHFRNSHDRLRMIAFPEKLDTNPHLHCFADLSDEYLGERRYFPWERKFEDIWRSVAGASATLAIDADPDKGKAWYSTKEAYRRDHYYLHSWDFHRSDKLAKRPSAVCLQRRAATRKPRTH